MLCRQLFSEPGSPSGSPLRWLRGAFNAEDVTMLAKIHNTIWQQQDNGGNSNNNQGNDEDAGQASDPIRLLSCQMA